MTNHEDTSEGSSSSLFVGVDGCRAGWFAVGIGSNGGYAFDVFHDIGSLWRVHWKAQAILIDIPIGLVSKGSQARLCDAAARKVLGAHRGRSVFSVPCREALAAGSYAEASRINHSVTGRRISRQAWNICGKIREVDEFVRSTNEARGIIRETHPEVSFWSLTGRRPMEYYKKSAEGEAERLSLLRVVYPQAMKVFEAAMVRYPRKHLARDDILDALANAVTAYRARGNFSTLPDRPAIDAEGLPMQMVYARDHNA